MSRAKYSDSIIKQAKELWEEGLPHREVAKRLNIKRPNTVSEWRVKFGWSRFVDIKNIEGQKKVWMKIARRALNYLEEKKFTSVKDALSVYERATAHLKVLDDSLKKKDSRSNLLLLLGDDSNRFYVDEKEEYDHVAESTSVL